MGLESGSWMSWDRYGEVLDEGKGQQCAGRWFRFQVQAEKEKLMVFLKNLFNFLTNFSVLCEGIPNLPPPATYLKEKDEDC